jgi:hypothetical protein
MRPNSPDQIWLGKPEYSWRADWTVNGWLFAAALLSGAGDIAFPHIIRQWPVVLQTLVALLPFVAILLWVRSLSGWIRGMDELHRRITLSAVLFAVSASFFVVMLWQGLHRAGLFQAIGPLGKNGAASWDITTVGHVFLILTFFYMFGHSTFNRRYQ